MDRKQIADLLFVRLERAKDEVTSSYEASKHAIGHFVIDDLLPDDLARDIAAKFPATKDMRPRSGLRERKYVSAQMDRHHSLIEEALFAFQDPRIVSLVGEICGHPVEPDPQLYAGGISAMGPGAFLNPHLDNSHDATRDRWRVLNLLYYVTPNWRPCDGGSLELWPDGLGGQQIELPSMFNRLVVMATHDRSWHSVNPVLRDDTRRCISNYYFSREPLDSGQAFRVTTFRGRPEQPLRDIVLRADAVARSAVRKVASGGLIRSGHYYARDEATPPSR